MTALLFHLVGEIADENFQRFRGFHLASFLGGFDSSANFGFASGFDSSSLFAENLVFLVFLVSSGVHGASLLVENEFEDWLG
jgi:hypothetical protein